MRRILLCLLVLSLVLAVSGTAVLAQIFPEPEGFVSDFAGLLSPDTRAQLESRLERLEQETGAELAVVTIIALDNETIDSYAVRLFEEWGIGKKGQDNGVLFLTSIMEREVRIEVGYGLEPIITDGRAGRILDREVLPHYKSGDYEAGILAGAAAIEQYIRDNTPPSVIEDNPLRNLFGGSLEWLIFPAIITIYILDWMSRTRSIWLGGVWGGIVAGAVGLSTGELWPAIGITILGIVLGLWLDHLLSKSYQSRVSSGQSTGWFSSYGGFRGGSSSGSSFGGFGGGRSGGAGASRRW